MSHGPANKYHVNVMENQMVHAPAKAALAPVNHRRPIAIRNFSESTQYQKRKKRTFLQPPTFALPWPIGLAPSSAFAAGQEISPMPQPVEGWRSARGWPFGPSKNPAPPPRRFRQSQDERRECWRCAPSLASPQVGLRAISTASGRLGVNGALGERLFSRRFPESVTLSHGPGNPRFLRVCVATAWVTGCHLCHRCSAARLVHRLRAGWPSHACPRRAACARRADHVMLALGRKRTRLSGWERACVRSAPEK